MEEGAGSQNGLVWLGVKNTKNPIKKKKIELITRDIRKITIPEPETRKKLKPFVYRNPETN